MLSSFLTLCMYCRCLTTCSHHRVTPVMPACLEAQLQPPHSQPQSEQQCVRRGSSGSITSTIGRASSPDSNSSRNLLQSLIVYELMLMVITYFLVLCITYFMNSLMSCSGHILRECLLTPSFLQHWLYSHWFRTNTP